MRLIRLGTGRTSTRKGFAVAALVAAIGVASTGVAYADNIQDNIVDNGTGVNLVAGSTTGGAANIRVVGNSNDPGGGDAGCNWDEGQPSLVLDVVTPSGVTADPGTLSIRECGVDHSVTFTASAAAVSGTATVSITSTPDGGLGGYNNQVTIPITVTQPANTPPAVSVTGVTHNATYEAGAVPPAGCSVVDAEDTGESATPSTTGLATNHHGLGTFTTTCSYTDKGPGTPITRSASVTYAVVDTRKPTISHTLSPSGPNGTNGWYRTPVDIDFTCADGGSGIQSCTGDTTLGNGANQSASGTATDWAGNSATDNVTGINVDGLAPNAPSATLTPAANPAGWNKTNVTVQFTSTGDNGASGVGSCTAEVPVTAETSGQVVTGTCTDKAGNTSSATEVTVKLDKTKPVISDVVTVEGTRGNGDWYTSDVDVTFTANDALSGPDSATQKVTSSGQGLAVPVQSPVFSDAADNSSDVGTVTKYFQIDKDAPTVGDAEFVSGTSGNNGWYRSAVTVSFTATDTVSGVAGDDTRNVTSSAQGSGIVLESPAFSDNAGNTTAAGNKQATVKVDSLAPNAPTASVNPAPNGAGWNKNDLIVSFAANGDSGDNGSGVVSCTADVPVTAETVAAGRIVTGTCTDNAGNTSEATAVTVKLDKTGPVVSNAVTESGTEGLDGWWKSPVEVTFTANDALSGPASETKKVTSSGDGLAVEVDSPAFTDVAGNTTADAAVTMTYKVDTVAPAVDNPVLSGTVGANGWYRSAVTASFTATDATSGVAGDNPKTVTSTQQGTDIVLNSPAFSDNAGNTTPAGNKSATVKVDSLAPNAPTATVNPASNGAGWNKNDLIVSFTANGDGALGSGVASCTADVPVTAETVAAGQIVTGTCTDNAGNTSEATAVTVKLDKTIPVVSLSGGPSDNTSYVFGTVPAAPTCDASDATSGLVGSCSVSGYATSVGTHTVQATATDNAGNTTTVSRTYTVGAWTTKGFYSPVDMNGVYNVVKGGSTVPLKFELFAGATELTDVAAVEFSATRVTCGTDVVLDTLEVVSTGGTSLRYDATGGQFIQNWKTPTGVGTCYKTTMTSADGSKLSAWFKIK